MEKSKTSYMETKLTTENVRIIEQNILDNGQRWKGNHMKREYRKLTEAEAMEIEARLLREMAARYGTYLERKRQAAAAAVGKAQRRALAAPERKEKSA